MTESVTLSVSKEAHCRHIPAAEIKPGRAKASSDERDLKAKADSLSHRLAALGTSLVRGRQTNFLFAIIAYED